MSKAPVNPKTNKVCHHTSEDSGNRFLSRFCENCGFEINPNLEGNSACRGIHSGAKARGANFCRCCQLSLHDQPEQDCDNNHVLAKKAGYYFCPICAVEVNKPPNPKITYADFS